MLASLLIVDFVTCLRVVVLLLLRLLLIVITTHLVLFNTYTSCTLHLLFPVAILAPFFLITLISISIRNWPTYRSFV
jgi:hypothetical protein